MPTDDEKFLEGSSSPDRKNVKICDLNKLAYEELILFINTTSSIRKVAFLLTKHQDSAWVRLVNMHVYHSAPF